MQLTMTTFLSGSDVDSTGNSHAPISLCTTAPSHHDVTASDFDVDSVLLISGAPDILDAQANRPDCGAVPANTPVTSSATENTGTPAKASKRKPGRPTKAKTRAKGKKPSLKAKKLARKS